MTDNTQLQTVQAWKDRISYDPMSGKMVWRNGPKCGRHAGTVNAKGYVLIRANINGSKISIYAHRLAFILMSGREPSHQVDHINGNRSDNRWKNLRGVTPALNAQNRQDDVQGFYLHSCGRYHATIRANGKKISLGYFSVKTDAADAYRKAKEKYHVK